MDSIGEKGSIPIPYIIAIIFGVVVIALLGYWFFTISGSAGSTGRKAECDAEKLIFCQEWIRLGETSQPDSTELRRACATGASLPSDVSSFGACKTLLGIS